MLSVKKLSINDLKIGMISANDILLDGKILLGKNVPITESILNKLKQNYIVDTVAIYLDNNSNETLTLKNNTVEKLEKNLSEFSTSLENIFDNISNIKVPAMDELRTFSKNIRNEFNSTGLVIRDIVLNGSGNDSIYRHSVNVSAVSFILGKWLGLDENEMSLLVYSAILHDFGKTRISEDILNKKTSLTYKENEIYKTHPVVGYNFVKDIPYLNPIVGYGILMHHERLDGSGYPFGLKKDKIHKFAKIIAIADLFDEINSTRYGKEPSGPFDALEIIQKESGVKLDTLYCSMFLNHVRNFYIGENVLLNNGTTCKIVQINMNNLTRPFLLHDGGFVDLCKEEDLYATKLLV